MQLSMLVFEEYVTLFRKKVAALEKGPSVKRRKSRPSISEEEFDLIPTEDEDSTQVSELRISAFLKKLITLF